MIIPKDPSDPINRFFKSYPVLSFLSVLISFIIEPSARTTSSPKQRSLAFPYFKTPTPPAFVAKFPPIQHDPFDAIDRGNKKFSLYTNLWIDSKITPASTSIDWLTEEKLLILFIFSIDKMTQNLSGAICPPTSPVPPLHGTTLILYFKASFKHSETSLVDLGLITWSDLFSYKPRGSDK